MWVHFVSTAYQPVPVLNAFWALLRKERRTPDQIYLLYPANHAKNLGILKQSLIEIQQAFAPNKGLDVDFIRFSDENYVEVIDQIVNKMKHETQKQENTSFTGDITGGGKPIALAILQLANDLAHSQNHPFHFQRIYYLLMNDSSYFNVLFPFIPFNKQELITLWPRKTMN